MKKAIVLILGLFLLLSCQKESKDGITEEAPEEVKPVIIEEFGYVLNDYKVIKDTIQKGESFGEILDRHHIEYPEIYKIAAAAKDTFDIRKLRAGKPYTVLAKNDSTERAQVFIYQPNKVEYLIVDFTDSIQTKFGRKEVKIVEKTASGIIESSLSEAIESQNLNYILAHEMSDIYAWTIDFFHLQKGDKFKLIYEEKFINDTIPVGIGNIKAAYFVHKDSPIYAFNFITDSTKNVNDYYDDKAKTLRRQFLKSPIKFSRISSRYNLKRRIKYYGNRVRAHRGTDFAASVGTPIMSTANGTVIESRYRGGNGNYVKVRHNSTYSTQYLHMKKRAVKKGDYVKQGDVIGYVGMTGNTSGPHVCYRFWKNGKQVDPFRQKLPSAEPIKEHLKDDYFVYIAPLKEQLDEVPERYLETEVAANLSTD
ncbi:M23 family metallopeptidase [Lutimonas zeaxanthinifaciens]|uniref:M23 family metallopeptidase n=1 Tax=Lutimonas zeaxanthinifaciens TaxID=3060215 RepID=UPI00265C94A1|nr:peptidoglycan DD-metalloendopeptidase family protein [Lutimonas sp. YSD2104]WKK65984.1 peptidoglycan DD-metalloendopeptidase family protein [Lutimonas sp. YSD2104]